jgi:hypothetical protein
MSFSIHQDNGVSKLAPNRVEVATGIAARPAKGLKAFVGSPCSKCNFSAVQPSTMGKQLNLTENQNEKVNSL